MKRVLQLAATAAVLIGGNAWATQADASEWYGALGVTQSNANFGPLEFESDDTNFQLAIGTELPGPFRVEFAYDNLDGEALGGLIDGEADVFSGVLLIDIPIGDDATLFGGPGLAYTQGEGTVFGNQIGEIEETSPLVTVGASYRISERFTADVFYRQLFDTDIETVGARFRFHI